MKKKYIKVTAVFWPFKESFPAVEAFQKGKKVGGEMFMDDIDTDATDKGMIISSIKLTREQIKDLFSAGDFYLADEIWTAKSLEEIKELLAIRMDHEASPGNW